MATPFPLQTLLDLSQLHLEQATRELGELIAGEHQPPRGYAHAGQLSGGIPCALPPRCKNGIGLSEWSNYTRFIARIDDAIVTAAQAVTRPSSALSPASRTGWASTAGSEPSVLWRTGISHSSAQEQRTEQKASDEFASDMVPCKARMKPRTPHQPTCDMLLPRPRA
jgi:flagellar FliJ protein